MVAAEEDSICVENIPAATRMLRIAVVTETYPPEVNGVSLTVAQFVHGLHRRNHDLQLVRPRQSRDEAAESVPRFHEVLMRGLPIPRYPHLRMGLPAKKALVRLWSLTRPDVVHVATEGPLGHSALHAAAKLKIPLTSDFRTNFHAYSQYYGIGWMRAPIMVYLRRFHNATSVTMVPTDALRSELEAAGLRNVTVVSRGVDSRLFDPRRRDPALRRSWGAEPDDLVVISVGRLAAEKNLGAVLQAFEAIRRTHARARLVLVGDGPLEDQLRRDARDALFAGRRDGEDLAAHFASADLFLFASLTETFGNVTGEAMASGLPVVAYDYAAAGELIASGHNGLVVPPGETDRFVKAAVELAADPARRLALGAAARETACARDWDAVVARLEANLVRAIQATSRSDFFRAIAPSAA